MPTKIITDREEARKAGILKTGIHFVRMSDGTRMFLPLLRYDAAIDLENILQYTLNESKTCGFPELNDLLRDGLVTEEKDYREYEIFPEEFNDPATAPPFTGKVIRGIIEEFGNNGFKVTREALVHNFRAWYSDRKSGFRDEKNGYHLFTPCGCNSLRFSATTLCDDLNWQTTYEA